MRTSVLLLLTLFVYSKLHIFLNLCSSHDCFSMTLHFCSLYTIDKFNFIISLCAWEIDLFNRSYLPPWCISLWRFLLFLIFIIFSHVHCLKISIWLHLLWIVVSFVVTQKAINAIFVVLLTTSFKHLIHLNNHLNRSCIFSSCILYIWSLLGGTPGIDSSHQELL